MRSNTGDLTHLATSGPERQTVQPGTRCQISHRVHNSEAVESARAVANVINPPVSGSRTHREQNAHWITDSTFGRRGMVLPLPHCGSRANTPGQLPGPSLPSQHPDRLNGRPSARLARTGSKPSRPGTAPLPAPIVITAEPPVRTEGVVLPLRFSRHGSAVTARRHGPASRFGVTARRYASAWVASGRGAAGGDMTFGSSSRVILKLVVASIAARSLGLQRTDRHFRSKYRRLGCHENNNQHKKVVCSAADLAASPPRSVWCRRWCWSPPPPPPTVVLTSMTDGDAGGGLATVTRPTGCQQTCPVPSRPVSARPVPSRYFPSRPVPSRPILSRPVLSQPIPSHPVPSRSVPSRPILSRPVPSCPISSHPIPSHPVPSHPIPWRRRNAPDKSLSVP